MRNLTSARAIHLKGFLFFTLGALASALLLIDSPQPRTLALLAVCVWAFARTYYYAFYVIEHYVDDGFRYSGLGSFIGYVVRRRRSGSQ